ncbi:uncharacterized protein LACBIDRAFT_333139 [Laccaria bicolor S238N-H82]|uniref:Predicted protein n=1 Tax=Laccaria bicolor (strain S238N-H82 / ATCC MYA-4686) TaxID=486041 RepID=B0DV09_LACBS|nr:uncharacterized protein LACBIDRAFT_333139 [Laccaria bicolor S238N-H82]EDR01708.1 predicted protein [Laccaria bicolor S238N-H82]|eukprot:XP_001887784.1 predicted protein [Laccaria bicolor S238N-H82]
MRRFVVDLLPWKSLHDVRDIVDTIYNTSLNIFESKERALLDGDEAVARQVGEGKDILSNLMRANMDASEEDKLDESGLVAQVVHDVKRYIPHAAFTSAAHINSKKSRHEITETRTKTGSLAYDELVALPYLDTVCRETLRLYPPVSYLSRRTRENIIMPLSKPLRGLDGEDVHEILVPNNTNIIISTIAANRNTEVWGSDSLQWIPERWLAPLPSSVTNAHVPGDVIFGWKSSLHRLQISQLEMKVVLSLLIKSFCFAPSNKEIYWQMTTIGTPTIVGEDGM